MPYGSKLSIRMKLGFVKIEFFTVPYFLDLVLSYSGATLKTEYERLV